MLHETLGLETNRVKIKTYEKIKKKPKILNGPKFILKNIFSHFPEPKNNVASLLAL